MANNITFYIGDENRIVAEKITPDVLENSIFSRTYKNALSFLNQYFAYAQYFKKNKEEKHYDRYINNVFAFVGKRGSGKTSCMQSIVNLLTGNANDKEPLIKYDELYYNNFYTITTIDPSFIDSESSIIGVLLATLFKDFKEYSENNNNISESEKLDVAQKFSKVQRDFSNIRKAKDKKLLVDDLEDLSSLSAGIDLKLSLSNLIDSFLKYIGKSDHTLIIALDDIDLNSESATNMVEEVRKYLVMDNAIILMALKLDQLSSLRKLKYVEEYKLQKNKGNESVGYIDEDQIDEMTERYITKLFPSNHRFYMPEFNIYKDYSLNIVDVRNSGNSDADYSYKMTSIEQGVLGLIYEKTSMLFYSSITKSNNLIPNNLRELRQLIRFLIDMGKDKEANRKLFETYIVEVWGRNHLNSESLNLILDLWEIQDPLQINATALRIIRKKFPVLTDIIDDFYNPNITDVLSELGEIFSKNVYEYNIAIGDVIAVIYDLENRDVTNEESDFLFMIKCVYTIRLHNYYNEKRIQDDNAKNCNTSDNMVFKRHAFKDYNLSNYNKLIGGRLFNTRVMCEWTPDRDTHLYRTNRIINVRIINEKIKKWHDAEDININELNIVEFFMLCTSHSINVKNKEDYDVKFRRNPELIYAESLSGKEKAFFDVSSFYYNVLDTEACYRRFGCSKELYERIYRNPESLCSKLAILPMEKNDIWYSWVHFRNIEILMDFVSKIDEHHVNGGNDIDILVEFFNEMWDYHIYKYDVNGQGKQMLGKQRRESIVKDMLVNVKYNNLVFFNSIFSFDGKGSKESQEQPTDKQYDFSCFGVKLRNFLRKTNKSRVKYIVVEKIVEDKKVNILDKNLINSLIDKYLTRDEKQMVSKDIIYELAFELKAHIDNLKKSK